MMKREIAPQSATGKPVCSAVGSSHIAAIYTTERRPAPSTQTQLPGPGSSSGVLFGM